MVCFNLVLPLFVKTEHIVQDDKALGLPHLDKGILVFRKIQLNLCLVYLRPKKYLKLNKFITHNMRTG